MENRKSNNPSDPSPGMVAFVLIVALAASAAFLTYFPPGG